MAPIDPAAPPIFFEMVLPETWTHNYVQAGGSAMNGSIQSLTIGERGQPASDPTFLQRGWAVAGSDGGHQNGTGSSWALNEESMKNLGYMQMKKTRDAAQVLMRRAYSAEPAYAYFIGRSQGGREALQVAQYYPTSFDGIISVVPIVNFSSLMLGPELMRIQEKPLANWVTPAKRTAIATEVIRQCDGLDGLSDGIINNYTACREIFDVNHPPLGRQPWAAKRCPGGVDPNPADTTAAACLTDGQISTLQFTHTRYRFATPLAFNNQSFGMWLPGTDPGGSGLIEDVRFRGQEGAAADAPMHSHLGVVGVTGFLMQDLSANPLDYVEGGIFDARRVSISRFLDATDPDLTAFHQNGGKLIAVGATNDTLASSGSQLDYFQSVLDFMGREKVDDFARLFVFPMLNHGVGGNNFGVNGNGEAIPVSAIPNTMNRVQMLVDWVEKGIEPPKSATATSATRSLPVCSYPEYPRYRGQQLPTDAASSYECAYSRDFPGGVGGTVPATLTLTLGAPASFGAFTPGVANDYTASSTASVISTAGDAALSVVDPSSSNTGKLVNGSFALPQPLQAAVGSAFAPVGGPSAPTLLKSWTGPTSNEAVTISFKQSIGANDALRTGTYSKTLTFTLSTTNP